MMLLKNQDLMMISMVTPKIWIMDFLSGSLFWPMISVWIHSVICGRTPVTLWTPMVTITLYQFK